ncbi:hypothetical protein L1887_24016 [Cichorium endivia]|nr:hypothetical protein L1887_24016 [Cichorium endivia]
MREADNRGYGLMSNAEYRWMMMVVILWPPSRWDRGWWVLPAKVEVTGDSSGSKERCGETVGSSGSCRRRKTRAVRWSLPPVEMDRRLNGLRAYWTFETIHG